MSDDAIEVVRRFNEALNAGDLSGMIACLTEDTVFENTEPAPDGTRYDGKAAVGAFWKAFLEGSQAARIEVEELLGCGERVVMRWRYTWRETSGASGHIRGIDVYRLRQGRISEKLSYVKG
ncbi:MAG: nuclear transport factor 2 family protein [Chloroflexi bacterium]|nr:nuclear transport factor 2 family protein [Chloroflexota bacterium]